MKPYPKNYSLGKPSFIQEHHMNNQELMTKDRTKYYNKKSFQNSQSLFTFSQNY